MRCSVKLIVFSAIFVASIATARAQTGTVQVSPTLIVSDFECKIAAPQQKVFEALADVANHSKILGNIVSRTIVDASALGKVLKSNEVLTVSTVVEPEERLALALFRLYPPERVEEEMLTNPFDQGEKEGPEPLDVKKGKISWEIKPSGEESVLVVHSEFAPRTGKIYNAERVNRIWSDHCARLEREAMTR